MTELLRTEGLSKQFRGLRANSDIDFQLSTGEVRCIIGPNGAGKTTFISMISGHQAPTSGRVFFEGEDVTAASVIRRARLGIGRKFQTPSVFDGLSAYQNLELGAIAAKVNGPARDRLIVEILEIVRLEDLAHEPVNRLSHGQRQWLEIGLLLAVKAKLLLLDEPTAGMTGEETAATARLVNDLARKRGLSAVIIEHDINFIRDLAAPVTVLHLGRVLREGSYQEIAQDEEVRNIYLGYA